MGLSRVLCVVGALALASAWVEPARAAGTPVTAATDEQKQAAQQAFSAALEHSNAGRHEQALKGFRDSHEIVASPNSRLMIARELAALSRFGEAYREAVVAAALAEEAAKADPKYADAHKAAQGDLAELKAKVGFVRLDLAGLEGSEIVIAGRTISATEKSGAIAVDPGVVEILARGPKGPRTKTVSVAAGAEESVSFAEELPPPPAPEPETSMHPFDMGAGQRITAGVVGGVGVVGMALFGVFGGLHLSTFGDLEDQCPNGRCPASLQGDAETGRDYQTGANVSLVIGVVGLAGGAALLIPTLVASDESAGAEVALRVGPGSVSFGGTF